MANTTVGSWSLSPTSAPTASLLSCHGENGNDCSRMDQFSDTAFLKTIFDWQNACFLVFILITMALGKLALRITYTLAGAGSYEMSTMRSMRTAVLAVTALKRSTPLVFPLQGAGFASDGVELEVQPEVVTVNVDRVATASDMAQGEGALPVATPADVAVRTREGGGIFKINIKNHAVSVVLASFILANGLVGFAAISEFVESPLTNAPVQRVGVIDPVDHVGFDTQTTKDGVMARLQNLGFGLSWLLMGTALMMLSSTITRYTTSADVDLIGLIAGHTRGSRFGGGNVAAAIAEGGSCVVAGMVARASVSGAPRSFLEDLLSTLLFFLLSQAGLVVYSRVFDYFFIHGNVWEKINQKNSAVALSHAAMLLSFTLLISDAIAKSYELLNFAVWYVVGGAFFLMLRWVLDRVMLPSTKLDNAIDNGCIGAAIVIGALQIAIAMVINASLEDECTGYPYKQDGLDGAAASVVTERDIPLADLLLKYDYTLELFRLERAVTAVLSTLVFFLSKYFYLLPFLLHARFSAGADGLNRDTFKLEEQILGSTADVEEEGRPPLRPEPELAGVITPSVPVAATPMPMPTHVMTPRRTLFAGNGAHGGGGGGGGVDRAKGNVAIAISYAAYIIGVGNVLSGALQSSAKFTQDGDLTTGMERMGSVVLHLLLGLGMLLFSQVSNDKLMLSCLAKRKHGSTIEGLLHGNLSLACIEAGSLLGSSFLAAACLAQGDYLTSLIFFGIGQFLFVVFSMAYERITVYDDQEAVEMENLAHGINHGMNFVAVGLLLARAIYLSSSLVVLGVWFVLGVALLLSFRLVIERILFPGTKLDDLIEEGNWGAALIAGSVTVSLAGLLNTFLRDCAFEYYVH